MKTGFIYIWYDSWRKMYYIGCHCGKEDDGYICSSNRMRDAYRRRPHDFKRRVIQRNIPKDQLLAEEFKWLSLIPDEELGKKYYNLSKKHFGHWSNVLDTRTVRQKISDNTKEALKTKHWKFDEEKTKEIGRKISRSLTGKNRSKESKKKQSDYWTGKSQPKELVEKRAKTIRERQYKRDHVTCPKCSSSGPVNSMARYHFDNCKGFWKKPKILTLKESAYEVTFPDGTIEIVLGMKEFCRTHNLNKDNMSKVVSGKKKSSKGFMARKIT